MNALISALLGFFRLSEPCNLDWKTQTGFTTNLLKKGAAPKDVQEHLGHSDVGTTMNIYAHANRETKRSSARILDQVGKLSIKSFRTNQ